MTDYLDSIIFFLSGLFTGIVPVYLGHLWSIRRTRKKEFSPYMTRLYGIVSKIMDSAGAENFNKYYDKMLDAAAKDKKHESAIEESPVKEATQVPNPIFHSPSLIAYVPFVWSLSKLIVVMRECKNFESAYAEMDRKGLIQKLKLRSKRLSGFLSNFHFSAQYVAKETTEVIERLEKLGQTSEVLDMGRLESIFQSDLLKKMLDLATHNLFYFGSLLEKELEKQV